MRISVIIRYKLWRQVYRKLAGNIPDSKTVRRLLEELEVLGYSKLKLVMDRGFYSEDNINDSYRNHVKFLISVRMSLGFIRKELDPITISSRISKITTINTSCIAQPLGLCGIIHRNAHIKGKLSWKNAVYISIIITTLRKQLKIRWLFDRRLNAFKQELETDNRVPDHEKLYLKYFTCKATPKRGTKVTVKEEVINKAKRYFGYFSLITNETIDAVTALELYRNKDVVEKAFGNLKERLNMRRALVSSEKSLDGKLFVQFVALIYLSYIKKQMQVTDLIKKYSMPALLDKLDVIECFEQPGRTLRVGEILDEQKRLYHEFGVTPPSSL